MAEFHSGEAHPPKLGSAPGAATGDLSLFLTVTPTEKWGEIQLESSTTFPTEKRNFGKAHTHPFSLTDPLVKDLDSEPTLPHSGCER